jgi:tRNA (guanine-N7-)-methyltransferase
MSDRHSPPTGYREKYLERVCRQNLELFDSPYVWRFQPRDVPLDPRKLFPPPKHTFLEIGFGHGEVLETLIPERPDTLFVGIERRPVRVKKAIKRLTRIRAENARLIRINLELFHRGLFVPESFDEILVNHPDPWPKKRHAHHRFFNEKTLEWLSRICSRRGIIEVASDHTEYFFRILHLFEVHPDFESVLPAPFYTSEPIPERPMSRYERKKRRSGQTVRILRFQKRDNRHHSR